MNRRGFVKKEARGMGIDGNVAITLIFLDRLTGVLYARGD